MAYAVLGVLVGLLVAAVVALSIIVISNCNAIVNVEGKREKLEARVEVLEKSKSTVPGDPEDSKFKPLPRSAGDVRRDAENGVLPEPKKYPVGTRR